MRLNKSFLFLIFVLLMGTISFVSASQNFLDKKVAYEYGKFTPELRQGEELNSYFKKLEIPEDDVYVLLEFNENIRNKNLRELKKDNIEEIGSYGNDLYIYKFPKEILENKNYSFIKWVDVPKGNDKMNQELKDSLNLNNSLYVKIEFYESYTDEELKKINRYAKFSNKDDWEENEIYSLVGQKLNEDSIHQVEEIASFNFVKSVKLIDIKDRRQMNLYINQSDFYENKSIVNQPHAVCPWQRDEEKFGDLQKKFENKSLPKIVSQVGVKNSEISSKIIKNENLKKTYDYAKNLGLDYNQFENSTKVIYDDNTIAMIVPLETNTLLNNSEITFLINVEGKIEKSYLVSLAQKEGTMYLKYFDQSEGVEISLDNFSIVESWGKHSCTFWDCLQYGSLFYYDWWLNTPCNTMCSLCMSIPNPFTCGACEVCLAAISISVGSSCDSDPCAFYPCQQDCDDMDGWSENWHYYCNGNDVWRGKWDYDYECSSSAPREGSCTYGAALLGQTEFYESCSYGCTAGSCDSEIECYSNSDCSADGWTGSTYCSSGDVWQSWRDWSCTNPGTSSSNCVYSDNGQEKRDCSNGCTNGVCDETEVCGYDKLEEDCNFDADDGAVLELSDGTASSMYVYFGEGNICGENYCFPSSLGLALNFDVDDCDGYLDESMKEDIIKLKLRWWNDEGEEDCSNTDMYYYTEDEDDISDPEGNGNYLTDMSNWGLVDEGSGNCYEGYNFLILTDEFKDDILVEDDDQIGYAWIPEENQDWWAMESWSDPELDVDYCRDCPDEDGDNYDDEGYECGTENDCDDYNPYINPGSNIYCDCNSGTGGGATQGILEICDNLDNDCDGSTDEGISQGCGLGICSGGLQYCSAGSWGSCSTNYLATNESCNLLDDNCDGVVDEGIASQECGTDVGACVKGTQTCSSGEWSSCGGAYVGPTNETCNSIDDNCNGIIDEDNVCGNYPNTTIFTPSDYFVSSSGSITFGCSSWDNNGLVNITLYHNITGNMSANETKPLTGISNSTTWKINNLANETSFIWNCLVYDINGHWSWSENGPYHASVLLGPPNDTYKFYHKNSANENVAWFGSEGNIVLKGRCYSGGNCNNPGSNSIIFGNSTDNYVAFINSTGDLCLEKGDCSDESLNCNSPVGSSFIVKDSSNVNVIYIDRNGELCLTGSLYENSNP